MSDFKNNLDKLVSKILKEEIENKVKQISEEMGEWTEIEVDEQLKGGQKKIDVAKPKGKITAADFQKLRDAKSHKKEVEERFYYDTEESDGKEMSNKDMTGRDGFHMTSRPKMMASFGDDGWYDENEGEFIGDFDFDYDEEEFDDFDSFTSKFGENQRFFAPGDEGRKFFDIYRKKYGPMKIRLRKDMEEAETEEGNAFSGALAKAKEEGDDTFKVNGKTFNVKEGRDEFDGRKSKVIGVYSNIKKQREMKEEEKWIQKTDMEKGALHKKLGVPEGEKIPVSKLKSLKSELMKKGEGDKKLSTSDAKLLKQVNLALTLKKVKESTKSSLTLTEDELIDMIEQIVLEQKVKDIAEKENIGKKSPEGLKKTEKVLGLNKKENDDYAQEVVKKMKDYMKDMFSGENGYDENPDDFPQSNYDMEKDHKEKKYHPSDAVEEYIEAFAYPGMTNLVYDEIKPDEEMIEKQIKGDSKNGNAVTGSDGKALGNVSKRSQKTGERFKKNFDENLYGAEQMNVSYKRQPQPVDIAGENKESGGLKKGSAAKAQKIMNQLESTEEKKSKVISEEMEKMKNLIGYNRKTQ